METSPDIAFLAGALAAAQGAMGGAVKDSTNPFFKSKYADLESVWSACRKALSDNGLSVIQTVTADDVKTYVTTILAHSSGQWIRETLPLQPDKLTPQGIGSCISYGRRYALAAIVGVYQTDDDAEAAENHKTEGTEHSISIPELIPQGAHKGKHWSELPDSYIAWACDKLPAGQVLHEGCKAEQMRRLGTDEDIPYESVSTT